MFKSPHILLASKSPRRHQILAESGFAFTYTDIEADEDFPVELKRHEVCEYLALHKATHYKGNIGENVLVTADTIVCLDDDILNKPQDASQAFEMLSKLSGRTHEVYTGVCIRNEEKTHVFHDCTKVEFYALTDEEKRYYISHHQPFDKAGAYGVQDWMGFLGVKSIEGCFYNVMGFPAGKFYRELQLFCSK